jgi:lipoyl(octanoyl) transferase
MPSQRMLLLRQDPIVIKDLGLQKYAEVLQDMQDYIRNSQEEKIWFVEHPSIYTMGTAADPRHIISNSYTDVFQSDRGGEVTYHGPGQLVIYFMLNIKKRGIGPKIFVRTLEQMIQKILHNFNIETHLIKGAPGVFVDDKKIASIGLRFSRGMSYHGISINVDMDLTPFQNINPCGYPGLKVTQIKNFDSKIDMEKVKLVCKKYCKEFF